MDITTSEIRQMMADRRPLPLPEISSVQIGNATMDISAQRISIAAQDAILIGQEILSGLTNFLPMNRELTLAEKAVGLPTMVARLDCTLTDEGIGTYEVEERPNGLGVFQVLSERALGLDVGPTITGHYENLIGEIPVVLLSPERGFTDDSVIFDTEVLKPGRQCTRPLLVRAEPDEIDLSFDDSLIDMSVSTVRTEGDKSYRVATGDARLIRNVADLPEGSFVLKARQGSKSRGVTVFLDSVDKKRFSGGNMASRGQIVRVAERLIDSDGSALIEPLIRPLSAEMGSKVGQAILRVFALIDEQNVSVIGGMLVATRGMKVHGTPESINALAAVDSPITVSRKES